MTPAIGAGFSRHVCEVMSRSCNGTGLTISAPRAPPALSFAGISLEMSITTFAAGIAPPRNTCGAFAAGAIDEMRSVPSSTKADRSERNLFDRLELAFGNHALMRKTSGTDFHCEPNLPVLLLLLPLAMHSTCWQLALHIFGKPLFPTRSILKS